MSARALTGDRHAPKLTHLAYLSSTPKRDGEVPMIKTGRISKSGGFPKKFGLNYCDKITK
jgi:hypothetical protein